MHIMCYPAITCVSCVIMHVPGSRISAAISVCATRAPPKSPYSVPGTRRGPSIIIDCLVGQVVSRRVFSTGDVAKFNPVEPRTKPIASTPQRVQFLGTDLVNAIHLVDHQLRIAFDQEPLDTMILRRLQAMEKARVFRLVVRRVPAIHWNRRLVQPVAVLVVQDITGAPLARVRPRPAIKMERSFERKQIRVHVSAAIRQHELLGLLPHRRQVAHEHARLALPAPRGVPLQMLLKVAHLPEFLVAIMAAICFGVVDPGTEVLVEIPKLTEAPVANCADVLFAVVVPGVAVSLKVVRGERVPIRELAGLTPPLFPTCGAPVNRSVAQASVGVLRHAHGIREFPLALRALEIRHGNRTRRRDCAVSVFC